MNNLHYLKWKDLATLKLKSRQLVTTLEPEVFFNFVYKKYEKLSDRLFLIHLMTKYQKSWIVKNHPELLI